MSPLRTNGAQDPSPSATASGSGSASTRKRSTHRACDYCREHRISRPYRCIYLEDSESCKHCVEFDIPCEKVAPPPKDTRPRKRLRSATAQSNHASQGLEPSYLGPTSIPQLAWLFCPPEARRRMHTLDQEQDYYRGAICDSDDQGLLVGRGEVTKRVRPDTQVTFEVAHAKLAQAVGAETVLADLYGTASTRIIPVFPVISKHESLIEDEPDDKFWSSFVEMHHNSLPPTPLPRIVRLVHCALAAMSRTVPSNIRDNVLSTLQTLMNGVEFEDSLRISLISNVQILMLLSMCDELNEVTGVSSWLRVGTALRMAQDLALHREVGLDFVPLAQRNRRARIWGACICVDRWTSLQRGQTLTIDLEMSDAPPPQEYPDHVREPFFGRWTPAFRFLTEFTKLSRILGRIYQLLYTPKGLNKADDCTLLILQNELDVWFSELPPSWPYSPSLEVQAAPELVNILLMAVEFTFYRPFLWPSVPIPAHILFRPLPQKWPTLLNRAKQAVIWMESESGEFYLDVWSLLVYPMVCCLLIHLKAFRESRAQEAKSWLERTETVIRQWAKQAPANSDRQEIAAMSLVLRETAGDPHDQDQGSASSQQQQQPQDQDACSDEQSTVLPLELMDPSGSFNHDFFTMLDNIPFPFDQSLVAQESL